MFYLRTGRHRTARLAQPASNAGVAGVAAPGVPSRLRAPFNITAATVREDYAVAHGLRRGSMGRLDTALSIPPPAPGGFPPWVPLSGRGGAGLGRHERGPPPRTITSTRVRMFRALTLVVSLRLSIAFIGAIRTL